jgi:hypothetical protein
MTTIEGSMEDLLLQDKPKGHYSKHDTLITHATINRTRNVVSTV